MEWTDWLYPAIVLGLGYLVLGITGFGSALVTVPLLAWIWPLPEVVVLAILLDIPASTFVNMPTTEPIILNVNSTNRLIYRQYNTTVTPTSFCTTIPPASLSVAEEWSVKEGVEKSTGLIQIITTEIKDPTTETVTGYNHEIRFLNVAFSNANSEFVFENYLFGNYKTGL